MSNDPLTKPKRRWKKPKNINKPQQGLTSYFYQAMLFNAGNKSARAWNPGIHGANRRQSGFFMRKISALHIMSGWAGSRKAGRVRVSGIPTCSVRRHVWNLGVRFKSSDTRDHPMKNSNAQTEQPTQNLNDLTLAFAKVCFDYGAIIEAGSLDQAITNRLNWLISDAEKLATAALNLRAEMAGGAQ